MSGVISAGSVETAAAGALMLKKGGNAVDAAAAAAFASFIAEIAMVHLGGSGMAHIYDPNNGRSTVYDFFSNAPGLGGTPPATMDFSQVMIDFGATTQSFYLGRASVAVSGNIAGLCQMVEENGRLSLSTILQPAIRLANQGTSIEPFQAQTCDLLGSIYTHTASMRDVFVQNGDIIQGNAHLFIPDLGQTLETLASEGADFARNGRLAEAIVADQQANGGLLTAMDLTSYEVYKRHSIHLPYRDYELLLPPPSSTGGALTAFALGLLGRFDHTGFPHGSARHLQLLFEIMSASGRARPFWDKWVDNLPADDAIARLLSPAFLDPYYEEIERALRRGAPSPIAPERDAPPNTSHLSVIDGDGLAVSLTTTAGEGAGFILPGTGYISNNMMGEEDLHPDGFHTRPAGQRLPTMVTPTIVLQDGQTRLVLGSGGSLRIRSAILQVLNNFLDYGLGLDEAVRRQRVHVERGVLQCEVGYDTAAVNKLEAMGYGVNRWGKRSIYFGGTHSVSRMENGRLAAAGDNRRGGAAIIMNNE